MCTATGSPLPVVIRPRLLSGHACYPATPVIWPRLLSGKKGQGALQLAHAPFHVLEALHHLLELRVLLEQAVDIGDLGAATLGDAGPAAAVDDGGLHALVGGHAADDCLEPLEVLLLALELLGHVLGALEHRDHLHDLPEGAHGAKLPEL